MILRKKPRILRFFKFAYLKLFRINDTPQKIALGFGLGVFLGIFPGTGPIAALFLAFVLRVNRAAALLGSILTNTWFSVVIFPVSAKIGALIMGLDWHQVYAQTTAIFKGFRPAKLLEITVLKVLLPVFLGYLVVGACAGILAYFINLIILRSKKPSKI